MNPALLIREIRPEEFASLGQLMVEVYRGLEGFPTPIEQPKYYDTLANIGRFTEKKETKVLVAISNGGELAGGVVYFGDMSEYGSGGIAPTIRNASGIRLLGVGAKHRGAGVGRALTNACIELAKRTGHSEVVLHTTRAMEIAWRLYERMGFQRSSDLDFMQEGLPVVGFRFRLETGTQENQRNTSQEEEKMSGSVKTQIQALVDRETEAWDTRNPELFLDIIHPDMVWPWPPTSRDHDPVRWEFVLGRFNRERWRKNWQELFDQHDLVHNRRETIRIVVSAQEDGALAVVDIDTLWRHKTTGEDFHWHGRVCKIYTKMADGNWKFIFQTGALNYSRCTS